MILKVSTQGISHVEFKIDELEFNHDPAVIMAYRYSGRFYDRNLNF